MGRLQVCAAQGRHGGSFDGVCLTKVRCSPVTSPSKRRLSSRVRDELAARLGDGRITPGAKLPPEPELAEELGVSRSTLREALRSLEDDGFVTRTSGAGTYATRRPRARNNLDVNFGVTDAIRAAGMVPGTQRRARSARLCSVLSMILARIRF